MKLPSPALFVLLSACLSMPTALSAETTQKVSDNAAPLNAGIVWQSANAEHVYGMPDMKRNKKGSLTLSADALTFSSKSGKTSIPRSELTAVSAGNQRVEMWGTGGRIMRMVIPDGGGLAAAAFMHHRVDMLTVEFRDLRGGTHAAVFFLPANQAAPALESFALTPGEKQKVTDGSCKNGAIDPKSVLVVAPDWDSAKVPAAYRGLVYEHVVDRLRGTKDVGHVYRDGESSADGLCPQYVVRIAIATFKEGSSVKRAFMGPVGMFVGTTQMKFDVTFTDASEKLYSSEQITATVRGESESTNVADQVAKSVAKRYAKALKNAANGDSGGKSPGRHA